VTALFDHRDSIIKYMDSQADKFEAHGLKPEATALRATASSVKAMIDILPGQGDIASPVVPIAIHAVEAFGGTTAREVLAKGRQSEQAVRVRHAFIWAAKKRLNWTNEELGKLIGGRDASTISHSISRGDELRAADTEFRRITDDLCTREYRCENCLHHLIQL
jgi:hypothetical protein